MQEYEQKRRANIEAMDEELKQMHEGEVINFPIQSKPLNCVFID